MSATATTGADALQQPGKAVVSKVAAIDCDTHVSPKSLDVLKPYLDDFLRSYLADATVRLGGLSYPVGAATTGPPPPATHDEFAAVLDSAQPHRAIANCLALNSAHRHPYYANGLMSAVNDWVRDEFLANDERVLAGLAVSTLDIEAAVKEIERLGDDPRYAHVLLPLRNEIPYGNRFYHPIYDAAARVGLPIALHAWGRDGTSTPNTGITRTYLEDYASNAHIAQVQMMSLVTEGVFSKFPDLKVAFLECGFTWLPAQLWRFDKDWKGLWREAPWIKERPSVYVRRHMRFSTEPAQLPQESAQIKQVIEMVGPEMLMYASDHPHDHGDGADDLLASISADDAEAILRGNAREFYGRSLA